MALTISGYVPFFNNRNTVLAALKSLADQGLEWREIFALDDGSTDDGPELLETSGFRCLHQPKNQGRGSARHRAMMESDGDIVICCDATNVLPSNFVSQLLPWFDDPKVAAVYGWIQDPLPRGAIGRWRARHLFKADHCMTVRHQAPLSTYGTLVRKSAVVSVGNYNPLLRHSEDAELGERLLAAGYDIVFDPSAAVICNVQNSLVQVLERYWRWYAGVDEATTWIGYIRNVIFSLKVMARQDLMNRDFGAVVISLICPHFQFWKSRWNRAFM
jgi:GT2 family glycosyltransferase